jgi:hypothetical protein
MHVVISRLRFILDCVFFYKLDGDCVFYSAVTDELTSVNPLLLWTRVATDVFGPSLLSYHYSDNLVVMRRMPMTTVTYDPLSHSAYL